MEDTREPSRSISRLDWTTGLSETTTAGLSQTKEDNRPHVTMDALMPASSFQTTALFP